MKKFWFDGVCSTEFGLMATGSGVYNAPERDVDMISIPGRNGDLILDNGRFKNITVSYPVSISADLAANADGLRSWLLSGGGYKRLEDEYHPEYFRMAMYKGPLNLEAGFLNRTGEGTIQFNCKPQRFLKSGEHAIVIPASSRMEIYNPTTFEAKPLIIVRSADATNLILTFEHNGVQTALDLISFSGSAVIDCETEDIYRVEEDGTITDLSSTARILGKEVFPQLYAGCNVVILGCYGASGNAELIPRWWTV